MLCKPFFSSNFRKPRSERRPEKEIDQSWHGVEGDAGELYGKVRSALKSKDNVKHVFFVSLSF